MLPPPHHYVSLISHGTSLISYLARHLFFLASITSRPTAVDIDAVVEDCISKLMSVKSMRPGTEVALPGNDIAIVVKRAREVFLAQPMLLEVCVLWMRRRLS